MMNSPTERRDSIMRFLCAILILAASALAQAGGNAAPDVNKDYRTKEGRATVAKRLANPERDRTQKPEAIVAALQLKPGMTAADIGTGVGYMLPFLSTAVGPSGKVIAEDIQTDFLDGAKARIAAAKLTNVTAVLGAADDPNLPPGAVDVALVLDAYHHMEQPAKVLAALARGLKKDGHLAIVEFHKADRPDHLRFDQAELIREVESNGFRMLSKIDRITDSQYLVTFGKR
ncbi:MAG: methyltransferase domain-containing protein [Acidobacteria bacterium]|nr:methyltransferase domain-containing protein [Acidobacteriota bacterium]